VAQRTLIIIKPDGVQRGLVGEILGRLEQRGLKLVGLKLMSVTRSLAEVHYAVHKEKPFFADLIEFITAAPVVCAVVEGPEAIAVVRSLVGATRFTEAAPGSIRGDFALDLTMNLIHASDAPDTAEKEINLFFQPEDLVDYTRESDRWVTSEG
jgi:nucleoside-diphosphate kinase